IEMTDTQRTSPEVPKPFDSRLQAGERAAVTRKLKEYNQAIFSYRATNLGADEAARGEVFEVAKAGSIPMIVTAAGAAPAAGLEKLAEEFDVKVAVESNGDPKAVMAAVQGRGRRIGIAADLSMWAHAGVKPADGLAAVHDRLMQVDVHDARPLADFFLALYR